MYLRKRLLEIKKRIGPVTKELGLKHTLARMNSDNYHLFFERKDRNGVLWRAATCFTFDCEGMTGLKEITWDHIQIGLVETSVVNIGDNGWIAFHGDWPGRGFYDVNDRSLGSVEIALDAVEDALRRNPLVPQNYGLSNVMDSRDMINLWPYLEPACRNREIDRVEVGRDIEGNEFYRFEHQGSVVEIVRGQQRLHVVIDGEIRTTVPSHGPPKNLVEEIMYQVDDNLSLTEREF
ncbi:hypothetical protein ACC719_11005 [Rhizobium ruizarguesonis]